MRSCISSGRKKNLKIDEMTQEQQEEVNLYARWIKSEERKILEEYEGRPIEEIPEEYREKIATLRILIIKQKNVYEEVIEFLETHNGQLMHGIFSKNGKNLSRNQLTQNQQDEVNLYARWYNSREKKILEEYIGRPIEEIPEEYREKIKTLRSYGLGEKEKTIYEEVIEFLETHNGQIMQSTFKENGKKLKAKELTQEQHYEVKLYEKWRKSQEKAMLEKYEGRPIEEIPEEYREKIARLRSLIIKPKTVYEEIILFLETHNGKLMHGEFWKNGKALKVKEMSQEQREEINLYGRWKCSQEKKILEKYVGQPIENVPEEHREKIARLREYGLGTIKGKLSQTKQQRDEAKEKNKKAKELEQQVESQLKKRGKTHEE